MPDGQNSSELAELEQSAANSRSGETPHYGGRYQPGSLTGTKPAADGVNDFQRYQQEAFSTDTSAGRSGSEPDYSTESGYLGKLAGGEHLGESAPGNGQSEQADQPQEDGGDRPSDSAQRDLGEQERDASIDSGKFDGSMKGREGKGRSSKAYGAAFRLMSARNGILLTVISGLFTLGFFFLSGLGQMIQAAGIFKDFNMGITLGQQSARSLRTTKEVVRKFGENAGKAITGRIKDSRVGFLNRKFAKNITTNLEKNGLTFKSNYFGAQNGMEIDAGKAFGINSQHLEDAGDALREELSATLGVNKDKIGLNGNKIHLSDKMSYSEAKRAIRGMDDRGKWSISGWLETRAALKREGYISWLHPIKKIKMKLYKAFTDWVSDQLGKIANPSVSNDSIKKGVDKDSEDAKDDDGNSTVDQEGRGKNASDAIDDVKQQSEKPRQGNGGFFRSKLTNLKNKLDKFDKLISSKFKALGVGTAGFAVVAFIVGFLCMIKGIWEQLGPAKYANIVLPAEKEAGLYMGYASQMMSGSDDNNMKAFELANKTMLEDDIPELDSDGKPTGKKIHSSYMDSPAIAKTLGIVGSDKLNDDSGTQGMLKTAGKPGFNFLPGPINDIMAVAFNQFNTATGAICAIFDVIGSLAGGVTGAIVGFLEGKIKELLFTAALDLGSKNELVVGALNMISGWLLGNPLRTESATPTEHGSNAMFGSKFLSNDQAMLTGGKRLNEKQAIELNLENRRYLAWKHSRKPLLARLFDPYDYSSTLSQLAHAAHLNVGRQDIWLAMGNALKAMLSAPTIMATAGNQLLGNNAYAASAYDYGVPTYAWSLDEMRQIMSDDGYGIEKNSDRAIALLQTPPLIPNTENEYVQYVQRCLLSDVDKSDWSIKSMDNSDGTKFNYADTAEGSEKDAFRFCLDRQNKDEFKSIRLYAMDYFNTVSSACYHGAESDNDSTTACKEMQVDGGSSSGSSSGTSSADGSGNKDAEEMQKKFVQDTNDTGVYKGQTGTLSTASNGCTVIPSWYIDKYTTLVYGGGNGGQVVDRLVGSNKDKNLQVTDAPTKAPAIFSSYAKGMHSSVNKADGGAGHTGLVVSVDPATGDFVTLESYRDVGHSSPWSIVYHLHKDAYEAEQTNPDTKTQFVYVGDYLK